MSQRHSTANTMKCPSSNLCWEYQMVKRALWRSSYQMYGREHHSQQVLASKTMHQADRPLSASGWALKQGIMKFQWYGNLRIMQWNVHKVPKLLSQFRTKNRTVTYLPVSSVTQEFKMTPTRFPKCLETIRTWHKIVVYCCLVALMKELLHEHPLYSLFGTWWHMCRDQIWSFGETDESI